MEASRTVNAAKAFAPDLSNVVSLVLNRRRGTPPTRALLVGISGVDASGKGYVSTELAWALRAEGLHTVVLHIDEWLNLPSVRFAPEEPARHFYEHALRLDEAFARLIEPLAAHRSVNVTADTATETATHFREHRYAFENVDVVLVEGIFLFKREYEARFDLRVWVECTFPTALERAVERAQEGLDDDQTIAAYSRIYFPAQRIHFADDRPKQVADVVVKNDPRLTSVGGEELPALVGTGPVGGLLDAGGGGAGGVGRRGAKHLAAVPRLDEEITLLVANQAPFLMRLAFPHL